ncbi:hypothetical protein D3C84_965670 [compost metagenome]
MLKAHFLTGHLHVPGQGAHLGKQRQCVVHLPKRLGNQLQALHLTFVVSRHIGVVQCGVVCGDVTQVVVATLEGEPVVKLVAHVDATAGGAIATRGGLVFTGRAAVNPTCFGADVPMVGRLSAQ